MPREFKNVQALREEHKRLKAELEALVDKRAGMKTEKERLALIPEAVRITGELSDVEKLLGIPSDW
jgi:hypothetical protein